LHFELFTLHEGGVMFDQLINRWWIVAVRGILAVAFGVMAILAPERTLAVLVSLFGIFALADGFFTIGAGLASTWLTLFLEGVIGAAIGLLTLLNPMAAELWFVYLIVAWAFVTGALELTGAFSLRRSVGGPLVRGEWLLAASGVLSVVFGVAVAIVSSAEVIRFMWTVGGYAMLSGVLLLALALNIRTWPRTA
jgi:uncharacterized membrane protein HdeD (DUF308 family)